MKGLFLRRMSPVSLLVLVVLAGVVGGLRSGFTETLTKVTIGHSNIRNEIAALWVPERQGIFRKYGLDAEIVLVEGGRLMIQAIVSGTVPSGFTGATTVASAVAGGADAVMILGITNQLSYDIWAKPEIKSPHDFKGKSLAISSFGSSSHLATFLMLKHFGIDPVRDRVTFLTLGNETQRAQALLSGRIDGTLIDHSVAGRLQEGKYSFLGDMGQLGVPFINNALVSTRSYVRQNPQIAEAIVKSILEANAFILNPANKEVVTKILTRYLRLDVRKAEEAYKDLIPKVEKKPYPNVAATTATLEFLAATNPKVKEVRAEQLIDVSILKRLDQEGFIDRLYR